ncbi:MAG: GNAT family N-acetyltransferase [Acidimicrobiales bacterium]
MPVRDASPADLPEIAAMIRELADFEQLASEVSFEAAALAQHLFGPEPAARVLVAETDDGRVAGFALWYWTFSTFLGRRGIWLEDLFVRPAHRGDGHGRALLDRVRAMTDGRVEWAVLDWNERAIGLYRRVGAEPVLGWARYRWPGGP